VDDDQPYDELSWGMPQQQDGRTGQNVLQLLFRVSEDATIRNSYVHRGCACNACGEVPIRGIRYRCANCADYDLCEGCEAQGAHIKTHIFYKIRMPAPTFGPRQIMPVVYTGDPNHHNARKPLSKELIAKLSEETGFERPELDSYWEQWTFMANMEWRDDPDGANLAMDKKTFERCLVPSGAYTHPTPSLIFDRMFSIYDTNKDKLIGFSEFVHGLAYRKKKDKWRRVFDGYDIDEDGYVERKDFLRIFRAYYVLYRQMHRDMLERMNDQAMNSTTAHDMIHSRKPLSSAFGEVGEWVQRPVSDPSTRIVGKSINPQTGDFEIEDGEDLIKDSGEETTSVTNREPIFRDYVGHRIGPMLRSSQRYWIAMMNPAAAPEADISDSWDRRLAGDHDGLDALTIAGLTTSKDVEDDNIPYQDGDDWPPSYITITDADLESAGLSEMTIEEVPLEHRRFLVITALQRDRIENQLHERWRRRQFYTEEEEGARPPANWKDEDDVLIDSEPITEDFKSNPRTRLHSRSSSRVRFADDFDDFDTRSNHSSSSRSIPERWGGMEVRDAEKDAGKEILYQVTQEAFNQLLDPLFKAGENLAIETLEAKADREKYRPLYITPEFEELAKGMEENEMAASKKPKKFRPSRSRYTIPFPSSSTVTQNPVWPEFSTPITTLEDVRELPLEQLLGATGYEISALGQALSEFNTIMDETEGNIAEGPEFESPPPRRVSVYTQPLPAVGTPPYTHTFTSPNVHSYDNSHSSSSSTQSSTSSQVSYDPTMPQFRPNSLESSKSPTTQAVTNTSNAETTNGAPDEFDKSDANIAEPSLSDTTLPSDEYLFNLWKLDKAACEAKRRGGWGRLDWVGFEALVKKHIKEGKGNKMDYLGSWIDFCIP